MCAHHGVKWGFFSTHSRRREFKDKSGSFSLTRLLYLKRGFPCFGFEQKEHKDWFANRWPCCAQVSYEDGLCPQKSVLHSVLFSVHAHTFLSAWHLSVKSYSATYYHLLLTTVSLLLNSGKKKKKSCSSSFTRLYTTGSSNLCQVHIAHGSGCRASLPCP